MFLKEDLMLKNQTAINLYEDYAKDMPIFDYHCHLNVKDIAEDRIFDNLTEIFIVEGSYGDHYKWRIMREYGVDESYITGDKPPYEKFLKFAEVIPYAIGNPIYMWTHLELKRYFGIDEELNLQSAERIYKNIGGQLKTMSARKMIEKFNVSTLCTTDDPVDDLKYHEMIEKDSSFAVNVKPAFRPDKAINIELSSFVGYIEKLAEVSNKQIDSLEVLEEVLKDRIEYFHSHGCFCSDHALDEVMCEKATKEEVAIIFKKAMNGGQLSRFEVEQYKGYIVMFFGKQYARLGWVQQYHIGAMRNNSERYMAELGADTGFDAVLDANFSQKLSVLLNALDVTNELPKTILYTLNPAGNDAIAAIKNCFQQSGIPAKIQFGSAWWFQDQKVGIENHLRALSSVGLVSKFVGMLTDSRSFMSYPRHEFFRRIVCNFIGEIIENGEYPCDMEMAGKIVSDICFNNANTYFLSK